MSTLNFIKEMKNRLTVQECDFLIDVLMSSRDPLISNSAKTRDVSMKTVIMKLAAQGDLGEGIANEMDNE